MKIQKKINWLFVLFFISHSVFAQFDIIGEYNKTLMQNWSGTYTRVGQYKVKGSFYFLGKALAGSVKYRGVDVRQNGGILYDLYKQEVGFNHGGELLLMDSLIEDFTVTLSDKFAGLTMAFKNAIFYGTNNKGYFEVLEDGTNLGFFKKYEIRVAPDPGNMYDKEARIFEQYYEYYVFNYKSKTLEKVKLRSKDFSKALGSLNLKEANTVNINSYNFSKESEAKSFIKKINFLN